MFATAKWPTQVTFRRARPADRAALVALAALDGSAPLAGDVLLAEVPVVGGRAGARRLRLGLLRGLALRGAHAPR